MGIVMGIMMVIMVVGFLGFGRHNSMMGGHGKETHNEATVEKKQTNNEFCVDCAGSGQDVPKDGAGGVSVIRFIKPFRFGILIA